MGTRRWMIPLAFSAAFAITAMVAILGCKSRQPASPDVPPEAASVDLGAAMPSAEDDQVPSNPEGTRTRGAPPDTRGFRVRGLPGGIGIDPACVSREPEKLPQPDARPFKHFGTAVALSAEIAVVSAVGDDDEGFKDSTVHVYRKSLAGWREEQVITCPAEPRGADPHFGYSVAVHSSGQLVIGATSCAFLYQYDEASRAWQYDRFLSMCDPSGAHDVRWAQGAHGLWHWEARLGVPYTVALDVDGSKLVLAHGDDDQTVSTGKAVPYSYLPDTGWTPDPVDCRGLVPPEHTEFGRNFGSNVAIKGSVIAVSATPRRRPMWLEPASTRSGQVHVFVGPYETGGNWTWATSCFGFLHERSFGAGLSVSDES